MIDIKFNYKLLNIVVLIIIFLISIISNLDSPFLEMEMKNYFGQDFLQIINLYYG